MLADGRWRFDSEIMSLYTARALHAAGWTERLSHHARSSRSRINDVGRAALMAHTPRPRARGPSRI